MDINFPYNIARNGRTATADRSDHVRDLIRQLLFTAPGERVNRPTFGCGLNQLVFEPNSFELQSTLEFIVRGALQEWLAEVIAVSDLRIEIQDSTLSVYITYSELGLPGTQTATFNRSF